jgi:rhamnulokinase
VGEIVQCVYLSLADCYRDAIQNLSLLTGKTYTSINIVGGGCQDRYLNRLTARSTGLTVYAGPVEGTAIGNLVVQMIRNGELTDLSEARACIRDSFNIVTVEP